MTHSTTLSVVTDDVFTDAELRTLAGFLGGYSGLTRDAYALDLRQFALSAVHGTAGSANGALSERRHAPATRPGTTRVVPRIREAPPHKLTDQDRAR